MRLDKYLKLTRLIKRRGVAKVLISEQSILVNQKPVKPSYEVKVGDLVRLKMGERIVTIQICQIKEVVNKENASELYNIIHNS